MLATTSSLKVTVPAATPASRTLTATGVKAPCGIKNVKFAVWSAENGQDDLKWYTAKASGSTYTCTMDVRSHKSAGEFNVYAYVWCKYGTRRCTKKTTFDASGSASGSSAISGISNTTGNHTGTFKITSTVKSDGELDTVKYQVYSNSDKSDSYTYTAKSTDSTYSATANVKNHKYHFGTYTVETYGYLANGAYFTLEPVTCTLKPYYYVYAMLNSAKDQAKITLVHNTSTGISSVQFPSWSTANGQDDIIWYEGTKGSGNTWTTTVYGVSHKDAGSFRTDVYLNGSTSAAVANVTYTLKATTGFTGRRKGIDVSKWNGDIKWAKVKGAGIKYAIIRCGYGDNIKAQDDSKWAYNVSQCEKLGIPYGVYIYSYATTVKEAQSEADHCIRLLKGHSPKYPVYLDLEDSCMANLSNAKLASITQAWATKIKSAGYKPGVYSSKSWWTNRLTSSVFNNYQKWVAQWNTRCTYTGTYQMWQYSSEGKVSGISGNVDMNYAY